MNPSQKSKFSLLQQAVCALDRAKKLISAANKVGSASNPELDDNCLSAMIEKVYAEIDIIDSEDRGVI